MAASPETPFALLLRADSDHPLPDSDPEVIAALNAYGVVFNKTKMHAAARLNLLAGLLWVHAHQLDLVGGLGGSAPTAGHGAPPRL